MSLSLSVFEQNNQCVNWASQQKIRLVLRLVLVFNSKCLSLMYCSQFKHHKRLVRFNMWMLICSPVKPVDYMIEVEEFIDAMSESSSFWCQH